jgi:hypothetical protein
LSQPRGVHQNGKHDELVVGRELGQIDDDPARLAC